MWTDYNDSLQRAGCSFFVSFFLFLFIFLFFACHVTDRHPLPVSRLPPCHFYLGSPARTAVNMPGHSAFFFISWPLAYPCCLASLLFLFCRSCRLPSSCTLVLPCLQSHIMEQWIVFSYFCVLDPSRQTERFWSLGRMGNATWARWRDRKLIYVSNITSFLPVQRVPETSLQ